MTNPKKNSLAKKTAYKTADNVRAIVEDALCKAAGITVTKRMRFDVMFDQLKKGDGDPCDSPLCPYREQHLRAKVVEREVVAAFGESWVEYEGARAL